MTPRAAVLDALVQAVRDVSFSVRAPTRPGEVVCLTGNVSELGAWKPEAVVRMESQEDDGNNEVTDDGMTM